jgi:hypothetical protein
MRIVVLACAAAALLTACDKPPVEWGDPVPIEAPAGASAFVIDSVNQARFVPHEPAPPAFPEVPGLCKATFATATGATRLHAAWWGVRPDSSAVLYVAASPDSGKTWEPAVRVDTTDVSSNGCNRPPPSLAVVGDDVYVAYSMKASEGTGVFFAHTMSSMIHSPVPVIYGERLVATAIFADSQRVAVAYEEPNGRREQVGVALSLSQGHLFEQHVSASRGIDVAMRPAVALRGNQLAVSWLTRRPMESATSRVVRVGRVQPWN